MAQADGNAIQPVSLEKQLPASLKTKVALIFKDRIPP